MKSQSFPVTATRTAPVYTNSHSHHAFNGAIPSQYRAHQWFDRNGVAHRGQPPKRKPALSIRQQQLYLNLLKAFGVGY